MIDEKALQQIKATKKAPLTFNDYANYIGVLFPLFLIFCGCILVKNLLLFHKDVIDLIIAISLILIGGFLLRFMLTRFKANFTYVQVGINSDVSLKDIAEKMHADLNLAFYQFNNQLGLIEAYTKTTLLSWGEKITIIHCGTYVLINSQPMGQPATIYHDKVNVRKVRELVEGLFVNA